MGKISKDSSIIAAISFFGLIIGYVNKAILFPQFLLPEYIGLINLIISMSGLFAQLGNLGVLHGIPRFFPFMRQDRKRNFFLTNLSIILFGLALFIVLSFLFKDEIYDYYDDESALFIEYAPWVYLLGAANLFFVFFENMLKAVFQVVLPFLLQDFYLRIAVTITLILYTTGLLTLDQFLVLHLSVYMTPFIVLMIKVLSNKNIIGSQEGTRVPVKMKRLMIKYSSLIYLNTIGISLILAIDVMMLAGIHGLKETGVYSTILFVSSALLIPYRSIYRVSSNFVALNWKNRDLKAMDELYKRVSSLNLICIVYLSLLVGWNIDEFFSFLPPEYASGKAVFFVLVVGRAFDAYCGINSYILVTSKKYYVDIYFTGAMVISAFGLNYVLVPLYGGLGAAWATCCVLLLFNGARITYLWNVYKLSPFEWSHLKVLIIAAVISIPLIIIPFDMPAILAVIIKSAIISGAYLWAVIAFKVEPEVNKFLNKLSLRFKR